jgi:hypothetical protein
MRPSLRALLTGMAVPFFRQVALGPLTDAERSGGGAVVFAQLRARWVLPNGRAQEVRRPQAFALVRAPGGWRLTDTQFLRFATVWRPRKPFDW